MPGIAAVLGPGADASRYESALSALRHPRYQTATLVEPAPNAVIAFAAYGGYPITVERAGDSWAIIEGAIYTPSRKACSARIAELLRAFERDPASGRRAAERWVATVDGDFLIYLYAPVVSGLLVLNDSLGRLALFVRRVGRAVALAREVKFLTHLLQPVAPDRFGCAQTLLFGWPLGNRSLIEGVSCLPPATSLEVDLLTGAVDQRHYHLWNLEELRQTRTIETPAESVAATLVDACRAQVEWAADRPVLLSLSGGLDSRAVAAGFASAGAAQDSTAVTFRDAAGEYEDDARVARQVAVALGLRWRRFELRTSTLTDWERLVHLRDGQNYVGAAHVLQFVEILEGAFGSEACYVTGDGGDRVFTDLSPRRRLKTLDDLVEHRVDDCVWSPSAAAALAGVRRSELMDSVRAVLESYPESGWDLREAHFMIMERGLRYFLEGEERNRMLMWSMAPLWNQSLFRQAMAVPMVCKRDFRFYFEVLRALHDKAAVLEYANWGSPLGSPKARIRALLRRVYHKLPGRLRLAARRQIVRHAYDARASADLRDLIQSLAGNRRSRTTLGWDSLDVSSIENCSRFQLAVLATLMMYFAHDRGGSPAGSLLTLPVMPSRA